MEKPESKKMLKSLIHQSCFLLFSIVAFNSNVFATEELVGPQRYCGGLAVYFPSAGWRIDEGFTVLSNGIAPARRNVVKDFPGCPEISPRITYANGIGAKVFDSTTSSVRGSFNYRPDRPPVRGAGEMATIFGSIFRSSQVARFNSDSAAATIRAIESSITYDTQKLITTRDLLNKEQQDTFKQFTVDSGEFKAKLGLISERNTVFRSDMPSNPIASEGNILKDSPLKILKSQETLVKLVKGIAKESLRPEGPSLAGLLDGPRSSRYGTLNSVQRNVAFERSKWDNVIGSNPKADPVLLERGRSALGAAEKFSDGESTEGASIAEALLEEARSIRRVIDGKTDKVETAVIDRNGYVSTSTTDSPEGSALLYVIDDFESTRILLGEKANQAREKVEEDPLSSNSARLSLNTALNAMSRSYKLFYGGDLLGGKAGMEVASTLLDVATGAVPGVGWARSIYEATTGYDLGDGHKLDEYERMGAVLGAATGGPLGRALGGAKGVNVIRNMAQDWEDKLWGKLGTKTPEILALGQKFRESAIKITDHAIKEFADAKIATANAKLILEKGTAYFDRMPDKKGRIIAFVAKGESILGPNWRVNGPDTPKQILMSVDYIERRVTTIYWEKRKIEDISKGRFVKLPW